MADFEGLAEGFRFDAWANGQWLECIERKGAGDPDRSVFAHILAARRIWLLRCHGTSLEQMPDVEVTPDEIDSVSAAWIEFLKGNQDDPVIRYRRTTGEELQMPLSEIATHVVDHGTYHRGELRGLCRARGDQDFPETGRGGYFLTKAK